jgi:hypothetical protein
MKKSLTSTGLEPVTFPFVAYSLIHLLIVARQRLGYRGKDYIHNSGRILDVSASVRSAEYPRKADGYFFPELLV